ncbi:MAG: hypothetical protein ACWGQW_25580, partial [bacterium]
GGQIKRLKGPPIYDAKILIGNGQLIMQGLQKGMMSEWGNIERWLGALGPSIEAQGNFGFAPGYAPIGGGHRVVQIAEGAVKIDVGNVANPEDVDKIQQVVNDAFAELVRELSQQNYIG